MNNTTDPTRYGVFQKESGYAYGGMILFCDSIDEARERLYNLREYHETFDEQQTLQIVEVHVLESFTPEGPNE